ncbi:MAG: pyridoxine 5'-phosphate synthase [Candidatus Omnitrophica bacterium]|nr:pyridoxine 5'-phosphate synthase [Candidatus Omnitrophota bacterium]
MKLGVNIDHVATLRQARRIDVPDPIKAAQICEASGSDSIVCHLREDRRHINDSDLENLRRTVNTKLNLEMACAEEIVNIALQVLPDQATLVPERREEVTTEGGLDVVANQKLVSATVSRLNLAGIKVSLFIDPERKQIEMAQETGVDCIELHTGQFANSSAESEAKAELQKLKAGAEFADQIGLQVFAGHGLNYNNVKRMLEIKQIKELNIGHAIIAQAIFVGLEKAVREMLALIKQD